LEITEEEGDAIDLSGMFEQQKKETRWAVLIRVCLKTTFSHTAFFSAMQVAWEPAREVTFRSIDDFTFTAQFRCYGDWKTAMHGGPWLFRRQAVIIEEYDGLVNTETIALDSIRGWIRIMGLPDLIRNEAVARVMAAKIGEVLKVEMGINGVPYIKFVRVYVKMKIQKPLLRFVSGKVGSDKGSQRFRVLYEKMPRFCANCGIIGHIADQCGSGVHDPTKFQYGDFMMVPLDELWFRPPREFVARPGASSARGRGRIGQGRGGRTSGMTNVTTDMEEDEPNAGANMGSYGDNVNLGETEDRLTRKRLAM
jgi:hypothetical protein